MKILLARIALALILLCVAAFCTFGFLATYEPMDDGSHLTWRIGYGIAIAASILTAVWILMSVVRIHRKGSRTDNLETKGSRTDNLETKGSRTDNLETKA